jgi:hypothetical protein
VSRYFAPITVDELKKKVDAAEGGEGVRGLLDRLGRDIKVAFDLENVAYGAGEIDSTGLVGYHILPNGMAFRGYTAGGDWEHPVFFLAYWDGKRLRGYVPTDGNPWNLKTKQAYGNDAEADLADAKRRWPVAYANKTAEDLEPGDFDFDPDRIEADVQARILPAPGTAAPAKPAKAAGAAPQTLQGRVEALTYYGCGDEGYELFDATCRLAYQMYGLGETGKAAVLVTWAEELAAGSREWAEKEGGLAAFADDKKKGHWG